MASSFIQVPPQSTGKKVATVLRTELPFDNLTGSFSVGDAITGSVSGGAGTVTSIYYTSTTTGVLYLEEASGSFVNDEDIQVQAVTQAVSNIGVSTPSTDFDMQKVVIADPDNPRFIQKIDEFGATVNTFTEGSPQFDAFGQLRVNGTTKIADYRSDEGDPRGDFWERASVGGASSHSDTTSTTTLSTTSSSGSECTFTTHRFHKYFPGRAMLLEFTVFTGDAGKANNIRAWGLYDDNDGIFFRLNETNLELVIRSSTSGSPVERVIPQSDWNVNKGDGTGSDGFILDLTKLNLFWIDYQWLGAGKARFGAYDQQGIRTTFHIENNSNRAPFPWMRTGNTPLRYENINTGVTSSVSDLKWVCASVKTEGDIKPFFSNEAGAEVDAREMDEFCVFRATVNAAGTGYSEGDVLTIQGGTGTAATYTVDSVGGGGEVLSVSRTTYGSYTTGNTPTSPATTTVAPAGGTGCTLNLKITGRPRPVLSIRPTLLRKGVTNRAHIIPIELNVYVEGSPIHLHVRENNVLTNATWDEGTVSGIEYDVAATEFTLGGKSVFAGTMGVGTHIIPFENIYSITSDTLRLHADGVTQDQNIVVVARGTDDTTPAKVWVSWQWQEL